jgi:hypothetical protein
VVADATSSRHPLDHNVALRKMELAGAHIATTEMCLFELAEKAGTETFKNIQRMVKGKPSPASPVRPQPIVKDSKLKEPAQRASTAEETQSEKTTDVTKEQEGEKTKNEAETTTLSNTLEEKSPSVAGAADVGAATPDKNTPAAENKDGDSPVKDLLVTIEKEVDEVTKHTDKTEKEIINDMQEIDKLIGTIDKKDTDTK